MGEEFLTDVFWDGDGFEGAFLGGDGAADGGDFAFGQEGVVAVEGEVEGDGLVAEAGDLEGEGDFFFEAGWGEVVAGGGDAGPADVA